MGNTLQEGRTSHRRLHRVVHTVTALRNLEWLALHGQCKGFIAPKLVHSEWPREERWPVHITERETVPIAEEHKHRMRRGSRSEKRKTFGKAIARFPLPDSESPQEGRRIINSRNDEWEILMNVMDTLCHDGGSRASFGKNNVYAQQEKWEASTKTYVRRVDRLNLIMGVSSNYLRCWERRT